MTEKPFAPWRPGDAFSLSDLETASGQTRWECKTYWYLYFISRYWNHRERQWYFHTPSNSTSVDEGYTGSSVVVILILLLWVYSLYRLWVVWVNTLNFDGVSSSPGTLGLLTRWVARSFSSLLHTRQGQEQRRSRPGVQGSSDNAEEDKTITNKENKLVTENTAVNTIILLENNKISTDVWL